jgi:hypothetical protein
MGWLIEAASMAGIPEASGRRSRIGGSDRSGRHGLLRPDYIPDGFKPRSVAVSRPEEERLVDDASPDDEVNGRPPQGLRWTSRHRYACAGKHPTC